MSYTRKEVGSAPIADLNAFEDATDSVSEKEEVSGGGLKRSAIVTDTLRYLKSIYMEPVNSKLTKTSSCSELTN